MKGDYAQRRRSRNVISTQSCGLGSRWLSYVPARAHLSGRPPPPDGSSPALFVCGGAQRGVSLATGSYTGEARRKPPARQPREKRLIIKGLRNHDLGALDSLRNPGNPVCGSHHAGSQPAEATYREAIESACIFHLTKLPPLTYPLIIEELRPEETPRGRF